ncbi:hypothetical protein ACHAWU_000452 [Discostella pseudostelligera]|uniref:Helicase-associated domain-containing protein n=1 Tax=Discostella pseudostelligera TaxID=259834 RepID=A0ABD3M8G5_9STRA
MNGNCDEDEDDESRFFMDPHARQHHRHHPFSRMHTNSNMQTHHPHALNSYDMNAGSFNMMQSAANIHRDRNDFIMQNLEHQQVNNFARNHAIHPPSSSTNGEFGQFRPNMHMPPHHCQHSSSSMYPPVDFLDMSYPQSQQQEMMMKHPLCVPIADKNISRGTSPLPLAAGLPFPNFPAKQLLQATSNPTRSSKSTQEDTGWDELYKALEHFHRQNGHAAPSARYKANPKLGRWVMTQRRQYTLLMQGEHSAMTLERIEKLECLGFQWSVRPEPEIVWNEKFQQLKDYKATYGNCMVPQRYLANPQLGTWVHTQRRQYKLLKGGKKSSMNAEKISRLNSVGFDWDAKAFLPATVPSTDLESD